MPSIEDQLVEAARAMLRGPEIKEHMVNNHKFNCKPAAIVRDNAAGKTVSMAGQLSHCLKGRPDDQIYYTVNFKDGRPDSQDIKIERGGVASVVKVVLDAFTLGATEISVAGITIKINPANLAGIATQVSKLIEGSGWEPQTGAIITYASILASQPVDAVFPAVVSPTGPSGGHGVSHGSSGHGHQIGNGIKVK